MPYEKIGKDIRCIADEIPFEIPDSWAWVRLGAICLIARGGSPRPIKSYITDSPDGVNWIKIGDTDKGGKYINSTKEKIKPSGVAKSRLVHAGDFLLTNSMSFGRPYILNVDGCIHDGWLVLSNYQTVYDKDFLYFMLSSKFAYQQFCGIVSGAVVQNLNSDKVAESLFPVPPLNEQKRIVKKIDDLQLSVAEYDSIERNVTELNNHFPEQLKKSILQWAIQGKLVPQDPNDEPASKLLERIRTEKAKLVKAGKLKKDKDESFIYRRDNSHYEKLNGKELCIDDEIPFEIPKSWQWSRLKNICRSISDGDHQPPPQRPAGIPFLVISDVSQGKISFENTRCVSKEYYDALPAMKKPSKGDILFTVTGSFGIIIPILTEKEFCFQRHMALLKPTHLINLEFLCCLLASPWIYGICEEKATGTAQKTVGLKTLRNLLLPIPPKEEQTRITTVLNQLFETIPV